MKMNMALAAVSMRSALKYRRGWNKNGPAVKLLQSLMPQGSKKKGYRLYIDLEHKQKLRFTIPPAVRVALQREGFMATDYLAKKCVKLADKEQKNVFNIGKVIAKDPIAKAAFDNDPQLQNSKSTDIQLVVSCHPYDIIGMSTGRDWDNQSCMRLKDFRTTHDNGQYHSHVEHDVAEGTLVAYSIRMGDDNIQKPLNRCLLKPFVNEDGDVLYRREGRVYGNNVPGFAPALGSVLRRLNAKVPDGFYKMVSSLYNDGIDSIHEHTAEKAATDDSITFTHVQADESLLIPYIKQELAKPSTSDRAELMFKALRGHGEDMHADDINEIVELFKGNEEIFQVFRTELMMTSLNHNTLEVGRRAGFFKELAERIDVPTLLSLPVSMMSRIAQGSAKLMKALFERIETNPDKDFDSIDLCRLLMQGRYPMPTLEDFENTPRLKSTLYTMSSAARYAPMFEMDMYEKYSHDLVLLLDGTPKNLDEELMSDCVNIGTKAGAFQMCLVLDNQANNQLDTDVIYIMHEDAALSLLANRRLFRMLDKSPNTVVTNYLATMKMKIFLKCIQTPFVQETYKGIKEALIEHADANYNEVESILWSEFHLGALFDYHLPFIKYVNDNAINIHSYDTNIVTRLMGALADWKGAPIDPEDNEPAILWLRMAVAAGRMMDPPVSFASKVDLFDMSNDEFFEWYKENKSPKSNSIAFIMAHVTYKDETSERRRPVMDQYLSLISDAQVGGDTSAYSHFTTDEVLRSHKQIIKSIQGLPYITDAMAALESYAECFIATETVDEDEAAKEMVDNGELGIQVNQDEDGDDEDGDERYYELLEKAKTIVENNNYKAVDHNSKLTHIAQGLLSDVGYEDGIESPEQIREFFGKFDEETLDEYEEQLFDLADTVANQLNGFIGSAEEYRDAAGYN